MGISYLFHGSGTMLFSRKFNLISVSFLVIVREVLLEDSTSFLVIVRGILRGLELDSLALEDMSLV